MKLPSAGREQHLTKETAQRRWNFKRISMGRVAGVGTFRMSLAVWPGLEPQHPVRSNATCSAKLSLNGLQPSLKLNEPSFHPAALALCLYYVDFICLLFRQLLALDFQLL